MGKRHRTVICRSDMNVNVYALFLIASIGKCYKLSIKEALDGQSF